MHSAHKILAEIAELFVSQSAKLPERVSYVVPEFWLTSPGIVIYRIHVSLATR